MKLQSSAQQKQLEYLRSYLFRWTGYADNPTDLPTQPHRSGDNENDNSSNASSIREAGRRRAAPHIKTYIRFSNADMTTIDWAMVTSANLSTQAWGAAPNAKKEVRICSWEIGVLTWPGLFVDARHSGLQEAVDSDAAKTASSHDEFAKMVPCFKQDTPSSSPADEVTGTEAGSKGSSSSSLSTRIGFRMPYDLPLKPYSMQDTPWCATAVHTEPDWLGQTWESAEG